MFRLKTLGGVSLERDGRPLEGRATQKRRLALLAFLAARGARPASRDQLVALLWPERDEDRGRHSLSQMLWAIRRELGDGALQGGIDEVRLDPAVVASDVGEVRTALAGGDLERAAAVYGGPFLDGFHIGDAPGFERWVDGERSELAGAVGVALETMAVRATERGDPAAAVGWWRRRAGLDPLDARVARGLMQALAAAGDPAAAIRHAAVHAELLGADLEVGPDPGVLALAASLRRAPVAAPPPGPPTAPVDRSRTPDPAPTPASTPRPARPGQVRWAIGLGVLALVATMVLPVMLRSSPAAGPPRTAILGTLGGPDSTLSLAVREALRAELARDEGIRLLGDFRVARALRLMRRAPETPIHATIAAEIGEREGVQYVITGTVSPLGRGVQLVVEVVDPSTRASLLTVSGRPAGADDVIDEVGRMARSLRQRLSALPVDTAARALPAVTTGSLEALEQYAQARRAMAAGDRASALTLGEGALGYDSLFVLAHYLVGDILWWADQQEHAEAHLGRARALADRAPARERLLVQARYQQLVADRPDSALSYYLQLRSAYPDEVLAYEGMAWTLRALGDHRAAAAAADTALQLDPGTGVPNINNRLYALIAIGDTTEALAFTEAHAARAPGPYREARYLTALLRRDWAGALVRLDSAVVDPVSDDRAVAQLYRRHAPLLALGRLAEGRAILAEIAEREPPRQFLVRALLLQGIAEAGAGHTRDAAGYAERAWTAVGRADLSAAAIARLCERIATLAAWAGDGPLIDRVIQAIEARDAGRKLRSYRLAGHSARAAALLQAGRASEAVAQVRLASGETFHGRSMSTLALLEADILARAGSPEQAIEIYKAVERFAVPDPDFEIWPVLSVLATERLATLQATVDRDD